ncbi:hypothetical protein C2S52_020320 [Perilla frutescens var. hirtella]|nr:hypothetical protein C2S52_020320 [Perilla frutescens var. hirtella]KAH6805538.1 hypothetical protein C2S51_030369 [Perilla frutescens var. frutescens]
MLSNQPETLLATCDEIISIFSRVRERLIVSQGQMMSFGGAGIQEWLRTSGAAASLPPATSAAAAATTPREPMDLISAQAMLGGDRSKFQEYLESAKMKGMLVEQPPQSSSSLDFMFRGGRDVGEVQTVINALDSIRTSPPQRHQRRRKDEGSKVVTTVPAPQMGNLDLPPEDGYTWRKYGQKEILGTKYPRSYYRCTHQKFYECPAKKQVQRLDDDPYMFEVTYRGTHTCHMSSTAPSAPAPLPEHTLPPPTAAVHHPHLSTSLANTTNWLSMHILQGVSAAGTTSSMAAGSSGGAGPSASRFPDCQLPVADMADAMFNSGSSSSTSMDLIFSSMDEKWDSEVKKA